MTLTCPVTVTIFQNKEASSTIVSLGLLTLDKICTNAVLLNPKTQFSHGTARIFTDDQLDMSILLATILVASQHHVTQCFIGVYPCLSVAE
jgi:hypothetical protein